MRRNIAKNGFSLLEVLVALAIFAVVSISAYRQVNASAQATTRIEEKQIALWVAENVLEQYFIERNWPVTGEDISEYEMAGREWYVKTVISESDQKGLRQLETSVYSDSKSDGPLISVFRLMSEN